jgi:GNAT superfamily N-acetyltransferase
MEEIVFKPLHSLQEIEPLRVQYLNELYAAQELFLELKVRNARVFGIMRFSQLIGYFLVDNDHTLLEYYLMRAVIDQIDDIFATIIKKLSISKALCKSFDHSLLSCCVGLQKQTTVLGILFREYEEKSLPEKYNLNVRLAELADEQKIIEVNEEVFDHPGEVREVIQNRAMFIFEQDNNFVGFGIFQRVIAGRPEFDIGMLVDKNYRRQGYGRYILRYLVDHCKSNGWRPIAGCAIENTASRRCLESIGYIARYRLLEFTF